MSDHDETKVPVTAWYAETPKFDGTFIPTIFHGQERPSDKSMDGRPRRLRNVRPLDFLGWDELTLTELHERFNEWEPAVA